MAQLSTFRINEKGFNITAYGDSGPVVKDMRRRMRRVQRTAKKLVGVDSGLLKNAIKTRLYLQPGFVVGECFANVSYALAHHEGVGPRTIRPVNAKMLRFKVKGKVVYATRVNHPGTKANPFLRNALAEIARG